LNWTDLTERQRAAASSEAAVTLVLGGAGTGKTTAALWAARKALEAEGAPDFARALFLTFSRTAVEQIADRSQRVGEIDNRVEISTFHAFALRMLRAFGAYAGRGRELPSIQTPTQRKLFGADPDLLTYDELVPAAIALMRSSERIRSLVAERWPLVICDEFQDTSEDQWQLLTLLGDTARLVLLADPNQMIYTFVPGVGPERLAWAREAAGDGVIELEEASHRDPSGVVPAMASAVRERAFDEEAVRHAVEVGALKVRTATDADLVDVIVDEVRSARAAGYRSVGIYGHSNEGVAQLGAALTDAGLSHTLVGIPEAQGEGIASLLVLTRFGFAQADVVEVRVALATFLTACSRGSNAPRLVMLLAHDGELPPLFEDRLNAVLEQLAAAADDGLSAVAEAAAAAWEELGVTTGGLPWRRASYAFLAAVRSVDARALPIDATLAQLEAEVAVMRVGALFSDAGPRNRSTTLMNFHQTKGREADAVILVYREGDYLAQANAMEPFTTSSRVLYVALTRARSAVKVLLPPNPHPLIAPFAALEGS
jgi:DNA helicase-2/ATP-dependent DNA helicase PcrA